MVKVIAFVVGMMLATGCATAHHQIQAGPVRLPEVAGGDDQAWEKCQESLRTVTYCSVGAHSAPEDKGGGMAASK
jgi:hypothetical protein